MGILLSLVRRRPVVFSVAFLLLARFYLRLKRDRKKFLGFPKKGVSRILSSGQPVAKVKSLWIFVSIVQFLFKTSITKNKAR